MRLLLQRIDDWLEPRTGLRQACENFFLEEIPSSAGWAQVFGSITLFLFLIQAVTGVLLALNFAPTPNEAYASIRYIIHQVTAGHLIRGLHHWGASLLIVAACLHMGQVFLYCAYKRPRELTWVLGVLLLLFILAFGLTGYLLPWDNRAYWGTIITTRIVNSAPIVGPTLARLAGAGDSVGAITFARFYTLHTVVLPAIVLFLIAGHLYLVRRHGVTPSPSASGPAQRFYPKQVFKDTLAIFVTFFLLFAAAVLLDVPLERVADPNDTMYTPRPEWYFLFLFQILKLFSGSLEWIGTIFLPTATVLLLLSLPFWADRLKLHRKMPAIVLAAFAALVWASLTLTAFEASPHRKVSVPADAVEWAQVAPEEIAGMGYFRSSHCDNCHNEISGLPKDGPNLAASAVRHPKQWLVQHFRKPVDSERANPPLSISQLNGLALYVANLKPESVAIMREMPPNFIRGAQVYVTGACASCHKVNGAGGGIGPPLNGLAERRSKEWVIAHFLAPQKLSPGSIMPPYKFQREDEDALLLYLFSLSD